MKYTWVVLLIVIFSQGRNIDSMVIGQGKMPAVTTDKDQNVHIVFGKGDSLLYSYSSDKGKSFSKPHLIEKLRGLNASAMRGPQITSTKDGLSVIGTSEDGKIHSWVCDRAGKWYKSGMVSDLDSVALEGFVSLASDGNNAFAVWLDLRGDKHNKIYGAGSTNGGKTWSENMLIYQSPDSSVCECCKPSVRMNGQNVYVMFRNWINGNRDMYLVRSTDRGKTFGTETKIGNGSWPLKGCPMDGGNITISKNGEINTVWRRENTIYACRAGAAEIPLGEGKGCSLESVNGELAYIWINKAEIICMLPDKKVINVGKGSSASLKSIDDHTLLCTWENEGMIYCKMIKVSQ